MLRKLLFALLLVVGSLHSQAQVYVLGVAQDGGYPHAGCTKKCCNMAWEHPETRRYVTSLALVDSASKKWWLFEATPDLTAQLHYFNQLTGGKYSYLPDGIFITHAHIGHYTGLMQLGREVMGAKGVPVHVMPKMKKFLEQNGPWSQLVTLGNIKLRDVTKHKPFTKTATMPDNVAPGISVTAFTVPHRDEYSETAGFQILAHGRSYLFIPDIDKWEKWDNNICLMASAADVALVDGTFFSDGEIAGRNMKEIPHPFVTETMDVFARSTPCAGGISKVFFIHFNHTNPILWDTKAETEVKEAGFNIAMQGQKL